MEAKVALCGEKQERLLSKTCTLQFADIDLIGAREAK